MSRRTEQALFFHYNNKHLAELGRIAQELKDQRREVVFLAARRRYDDDQEQ